YPLLLFFFFNGPAPTDTSTLSLHDALPISHHRRCGPGRPQRGRGDDGLSYPAYSRPVVATHGGRRMFGCGGSRAHVCHGGGSQPDRKSTRLNSSHVKISYAVFCLKKKKIKK